MVNIKSKEKIKSIKFRDEKALQKSIEENMEALLNAYYVKSEFSTSNGGRMDSLGIDIETGSPVIVEYKAEKSKDLVNQLIFYYNWLIDHEDTFNRIVSDKFKGKIRVNWTEGVRLICIAQKYTDWDFSLLEHLKTDIELMKYSYYSNGCLVVQRVNEVKLSVQKTSSISSVDFEHHRNKGNEKGQNLLDALREKVLELGDNIAEGYTPEYIKYLVNNTFLAVHVRKELLRLQLRVNESKFKDPKKMGKDISSRGWTVTREVILDSLKDIPYVMRLVKQAYETQK